MFFGPKFHCFLTTAMSSVKLHLLLGFVSSYDFSIGFWNCSDSVVFFFYFFLVHHLWTVNQE